MKHATWLARAFALFILAVSAMGMHAARMTSKGTIASTAGYMTIQNR